MSEQPEDMVVTPWDVSGELDYEKLIERFGTKPMTQSLLRRLEAKLGELHPMLRRGIVFSHRDFDWLLDHIEKRGFNDFALYTGRGPSGNTHIGHLVPWQFTKWLQERFDVHLYFQITDDEKFLLKPLKRTYEEMQQFALENAKDVMAVGFDPEKTHIIIDSQAGPKLREIATKVASRITFSTVKAVFGFTESTNIGMIFHPAIQSAPCFYPSVLEGRKVPVLIPAGIDQDPYWRATRDVAEKLGFYKPTALHSEFIPGLGKGGKMSASEPNSTIFTTDTGKAAIKKVKRAVTGGRQTIAEQKEKGGIPEVCNVYAWYRTIFEDDDEALRRRYEDCRSGSLMCGPCKQELGERVALFLERHQERREAAEELLDLVIIRE